MLNSKNYRSSSPLICPICRADNIALGQIHQTKVSHTIYCRNCSDLFSEEDIELMANMFTAFGGYFGRDRKEFQRDDEVLEQLLATAQEDVKRRGEAKNETAFRVSIIHKSLLLGITPASLQKILKNILDC